MMRGTDPGPPKKPIQSGGARKGKTLSFGGGWIARVLPEIIYARHSLKIILPQSSCFSFSMPRRAVSGKPYLPWLCLVRAPSRNPAGQSLGMLRELLVLFEPRPVGKVRRGNPLPPFQLDAVQLQPA